VCRNPGKAEEVARAIREVGGEAELEQADLASLAQVRRAGAAIVARHPRLALLVNNAGIFNLRQEWTEDGLEAVFAVNHLAPFLLTRQLEPALRAAGAARVVNVASEAHRFGALDLDDPCYERRRWRPMQAYGQSKLANILFTRELARRLAGSAVTANCLHPGGVATGLASNNGWIAQLAMRLLGPFMRTPEQGARTTLYLALSPEVAGVSGEYFADGKRRTPSRAASSDEAAARLWELSERLTAPPAAP